MKDCYQCGDGLMMTADGWRHDDDLGIGVDGRIVVTDCQWGKPYAPNNAAGMTTDGVE